MGTVPTFTPVATQSDLTWWQATRPLFSAYQTTAQTGVASGAWTAVNLQTTVIDRDGGHVGTSGRYTIGNTTGRYLVAGVVAFAGSGGTVRAAKLVFNGADVPGSVIELPGSGVMTVAIPPVYVASTSPGDYVELQCFHDNGTTISLQVNAGMQSGMTLEFAGV